MAFACLCSLVFCVQQPTPDWSVMIYDSIMNYRSSPHLIIIPGLFVYLLIYSLNFIGEHLRDSLDTQLDEVRKW